MRGRIKYLKHLEDADYISEIDAAALRGAHRFAGFLLFFILAFFGLFLLWASFAEVDEVIRGQGRIVPSGAIQTAANLEGGILEEVLVNEGQIVERGQALLRIQNTLAAADYRESRRRYLGLLAQISRLEAELGDKDKVDFPEEVTKEAPDVASNEEALFFSRESQLDSQIDILRDQFEQKQQELRELDGRISKLQESLALVRKEYNIIKPLAEQGVTPKLDALRLEREVNELESQLQSTKLARPRAESAIREAEKRLEEKRNAFLNEARRELNELRGELGAISESITAEQDRVRRTEVQSPVRGTVKEIKLRSIGGVIRPGEPLVDIVPLDDKLLVEAQVAPKDIAFLAKDLPATIKLTALDFTIYGGLDAVLVEISPDTITDEKGNSFYRVKLETDKNHLIDPKTKKPREIIPGMVAQVDILTGNKKTILDYLLKPFIKGYRNAFRER